MVISVNVSSFYFQFLLFYKHFLYISYLVLTKRHSSSVTRGVLSNRKKTFHWVVNERTQKRGERVGVKVIFVNSDCINFLIKVSKEPFRFQINVKTTPKKHKEDFEWYNSYNKRALICESRFRRSLLHNGLPDSRLPLNMVPFIVNRVIC